MCCEWDEVGSVTAPTSHWAAGLSLGQHAAEAVGCAVQATVRGNGDVGVGGGGSEFGQRRRLLRVLGGEIKCVGH